MFDLGLYGRARPLARTVIGATTADDYQVNVAPGHPAYAPAADKLIKEQESSGHYATDVQPVIKAGTEIWSGWGSGAFGQEAIWAKRTPQGSPAARASSICYLTRGPQSRTGPRLTATRSVAESRRARRASRAS